MVLTGNSMGSSEIWDKYHKCCIGNGDKFHSAKLLPMLLLVHITDATAIYPNITHSISVHVNFRPPLRSFWAEPCTTGVSSFTVMCDCANLPFQHNWNHSLLHTAPHPHVPEASEIMTATGCCLLSDKSMETRSNPPQSDATILNRTGRPR